MVQYDARKLTTDLANEIVDFYGYECEATIAFHMLAVDVQNMHRDPSFTGGVGFHRDTGSGMFTGEAYSRSTEELLNRMSPAGDNTKHRHQSMIAFIASRWEDYYRQKIANFAGLPEKNCVQSDVFRDLSVYRNSILHNNGIMKRKPIFLKLFNKGDIILFSEHYIDTLFEILIEEVNIISEKYLNIKTEFRLRQPDKSIPIYISSNTFVQYPSHTLDEPIDD